MEHKQDFLTINPFTRCGRKLDHVAAIIIHWVAAPGQKPAATRQYWEDRKNGNNGYGSAHYIVSIYGDVLQTIPDDEIGYHCGATSPIKEGSDQYYTDEARARWPGYTLDYKRLSPNQITIGIELCHRDWTGELSPETKSSAIELAAVLCKSHGLDPMRDILRHQDIVGYKECPRWLCRHPDDWTLFRTAVKVQMGSI